MENRALFLWQCERRKSSLMNKNVANRQILIASAGKSRLLHLVAAHSFPPPHEQTGEWVFFSSHEQTW